MDQPTIQQIVDFIQLSIASGVTGSVAYDLIKASFSGIKNLFLSDKNDTAKIRGLIEAELNKNPELLKECEKAYHISIKNGDYIKGDKYVIKGDNVGHDKIGTQINYNAPPEKKKKKNLNPISPLDESDIIGRETKLDELHKLFQNNSSAVLVNGIGGIGKTTIALAYINFAKYNSEYDHLAWVTVNNNIKDSMIDQLQTEDTKFKFEIDKDNFKELMEILRHIEGNKLLVIDNANDDTDINDTLSTLEKLEWKLLFTSRCNIKGHTSLPVDILDEKDAVTLFKKYCTEVDDKSLLELLKQIEYHTLLIELLAKAIEENPFLDIKGAYDLLKGWNLKDDLLQSEITTQHNLTTEEKQRLIKIGNYIFAVFKPEKLNEEEIKYLLYFSILPSLPIKFEDLIKYFDVKDITLTQFNNILKGLQRKGWLTEIEKYSYKMHPLIQAVIREKLQPNAENCEGIIVSFAKLLKCDPYESPISKKELIPFVDSLLKSIKFNLNYITNTYSELSKLIHNFGIILKALGENVKALNFLKQSLKIQKILCNTDYVFLSAVYNNIALIYIDLGNNKNALNYINKTIKIIKQIPYYNKLNLATIYGNKAIIYGYLGYYKNELIFNNIALKIIKEVIPIDDELLAINYGNLGRAYLNLANYRKSLYFIKKSIKIKEKLLKIEHPNLATSYQNLSFLYNYLGYYKKAIKYVKKAIKIHEETLGFEHIELANSYDIISGIYKNIGYYKKATIFIQKAINIYVKFFDSKHPSLARAYSNLASILSSCGKFKQAIEYHYKAIALSEEIYDKNHSELATTYDNIAITYDILLFYKIGLEFHIKALEIRKTTLGEEHFEFGLSCFNLATVYYHLKDIKKAKYHIGLAIKIFVKTLPNEHPNLKLCFEWQKIINNALNNPKKDV